MNKKLKKKLNNTIFANVFCCWFRNYWKKIHFFRKN